MSRLAIRTAELAAAITFERFAGLPTEEVERLHDAVELLPLDEAAVRSGQQQPLFLMVAMHHNYRWLVHVHDAAPRSLYVATPLSAASEFLDARMTEAARVLVNEWVPSRDDYSLRCAGLVRLCDSPQLTGLGVLYLARLHRRVEDCLARSSTTAAVTRTVSCGSGELLQEREQFDQGSRALIDQLTAL